MASVANSTISQGGGFDGDDFSNNLFTDLGPLLALFGGEITTQFMSQTVTIWDSIILAIAPLGVVTAMTGAIRVGGPRMLRTLIGRARESRASIEIQQLSSTSNEVCELWNGETIVRTQGMPKIAEILLCRNAAGVWELGTRQALPASLKGRVHVSGKEGRGPPNISHNYNPPRYPGEAIVMAILAILLQIAGLGLQAYFVYWLKLKKGDDDIPSNAFPLFAIGTVVMSLGLFICSYVVESATSETWYHFPNGHGVKVMWIQRGCVVSDQQFDSYAISASDRREWIMASHRGPAFGEFRKDVQEERQPLLQPDPESKTEQEENDDSNVLAKDQRKEFLSILRVRFLTVVGVILSLSGYIVQFIGIRRNHWSASIIQLTLAIVMAIVRSIERRNLWDQPPAQLLEEDYELDWLATRAALVNDDEDEGDGGGTPSGRGSRKLWRQFRSSFSSLQLGMVPSSVSKKRKTWYSSKTVEFFLVDVTGESQERPSVKVIDLFENSTGFSSSEKKPSPTPDGKSTYKSSETGAGNTTAGARGDTRTKESTRRLQCLEVLRHRIKLGAITDFDSNSDLSNSIAARLRHAIHRVTELLDSGVFQMSEDYLANGLTWRLHFGDRREALSIPMKGLARPDLHSMLVSILSLCMFDLYRRGFDPNGVEKTYWNLGPKDQDSEQQFKWWIPASSDAFENEGVRNVDVLFESEPDSGIQSRLRKIKLLPRHEDGEEISIENPCFMSGYKEGTNPPLLENQLVVERKEVTLLFSYARKLLWTFVEQAVRAIDKITTETELAATDGLPNTLASHVQRDPKSFFDSIKFNNVSLNMLATAISSTKVESLENSYMAFIPELHRLGKLPQPNAIIGKVHDITQKLQEEQNWYAATAFYQELIRTTKAVDEDLDEATQGSQERSKQEKEQLNARAAALAAEFYPVLEAARDVYKLQGIREYNDLNPNSTYLGPVGQCLLLLKEAISSVDDHIRSDISDLYSFQGRNRLPKDLSIIKSGRQNQKPRTVPRFSLWTDYFVDFNLEDYFKISTTPSAKDATVDVLGWSLLHYIAARPQTRDSIKHMELFLKHGWHSDIRNLHGRTPLHIAAESGNVGAINLLVQFRSKLDARDRNGETPLHRAIYRGNVNEDIVTLLCEKGVDIDARDNFLRTPAFLAASQGALKLLKALLDFQASVRARDSHGMSCLHAVCGQSYTRLGLEEIIQELLSPNRGGSLTARDQGGRTPLHCAAQFGSQEALTTLLRFSIAEIYRHPESERKEVARKHLSPLDQYDQTPLHTLVVQGRSKILDFADDSVKTFLENNLMLRDGGGQSVLHVASQSGDISFAKFALESGVQVIDEDNNGCTPFHNAKDEKIMELLLQHLPEDKALTEFRSKTGGERWSPLHSYTCTSVLKFLLGPARERYRVLRYGEQLASHIDGYGKTVLHHASARGNAEDIHLLAPEISIETRDQFDQTPLHVAAEYRNSITLSALVKHMPESPEDRYKMMDRIHNVGQNPILCAINTIHIDTDRPDLSSIPQEYMDLLQILAELGPPNAVTDAMYLVTNLTWKYGVEIMTKFLKYGLSMDEDIKENYGKSLLHFAVSKGRMEIAKVLVEAGYDFERKNGDGNTALDLIDSDTRREAVKKQWEKIRKRRMDAGGA